MRTYDVLGVKYIGLVSHVAIYLFLSMRDVTELLLY